MGSLQRWILLACLLPHQQGVSQYQHRQLSQNVRPPLSGMSFLELLSASALEKRFIHHGPPRISINLTVSAEEPILSKKGNVNPCSRPGCSCPRNQPRLVGYINFNSLTVLFNAVPVNARLKAPTPPSLCLFFSPCWLSCYFSLLFYD